MRQTIRPGMSLDFVTPDEIVSLIPREPQTTRIRAMATIQLNANGVGEDEVYMVPAGGEFEARRAFMTLSGLTPPLQTPNTGNVALSGAGLWVAYLRSGTLIEYAQPQVNGLFQVPGAQSWSREQGPYLRNKEIMQINVNLGVATANLVLAVVIEGILKMDAQNA